MTLAHAFVESKVLFSKVFIRNLTGADHFNSIKDTRHSAPPLRKRITSHYNTITFIYNTIYCTDLFLSYKMRGKEIERQKEKDE